MKKKFLLFTALSAMTLGVSAGFIAHKVAAKRVNADETYHLVLNDEVSVGEASYQPTLTRDYGTVAVNYVRAKANDAGHVTLAPHGKIYNYTKEAGMNKGKINGIKSITATFTGTLSLQLCRDADGKIMTDKVQIPSGTKLDVEPCGASYFILTAGDTAVDVTSIDVEYSCETTRVLDLIQIGNEYTGLKGDLAYKLTRTGTSATLVTLNKEGAQDHYTGTLSVENGQLRLAITEVGNSLYFNVSEDRGTLSIDGTKGAGAAFAGLSFTEVYNVEDYERYTSTGQGYDSTHTIYQTSGLRAEYHADYYATGRPSLFGNSNWSNMGSTDYITLANTAGHNDSKCGLFKVNTNQMRYCTMDSFLARPTLIGQGSTFSFWAKGAFSSTAATTQSSNAVTLKVRLFFVDALTRCDDTVGVAQEFTIPAGSDWTQYEMPIPSGKQIYGYSFFSKTNGNYLAIDDIQVYNVNPYTEYVPPVDPGEEKIHKTFNGIGTINLSGAAASAFGSTATINLAINDSQFATAYILGKNMEDADYTIDEDRNFTMTGVVDSYSSYGITLTGVSGKFNETFTELTNVTLEGEGAGMALISNNGSITIGDNYITRMSFEGMTTAQIQATLKRQWNNGSWQNDASNTDRFTAVTTDAAEGSTSVKERGYTKFSAVLAEDISITANGLGFWVKNISSKTLKAKYFYYLGENLSNNGTYMSDVTVPANSDWTFLVCNFGQIGSTTKTIKNFRLYFELASGTGSDYILIDNICLY